MPLKIPKHIGPQTRSLIEAALEDAWQELNKDGDLETTPARNKLRTTIVALASVGETDHRKLKWFAIPCLARSTTSGAIVVSTTRTDERNAGLTFALCVAQSKRNGPR